MILAECTDALTSMTNFETLKKFYKKNEKRGVGIEEIYSNPNWSNEGFEVSAQRHLAGKVGQVMTIDIKGKFSLIHFLI